MSTRFSRRTLRDKLLLVFLAPTLLIVSGFGLLAYYTAYSELEQELGKRLISIGQTLSAQLSQGVEASQIDRLDPKKTRTIARLQARLSSVKSRTDTQRVFLVDRDFKSLIDTDPNIKFGQKLFSLEADRFEIEAMIASQNARASVLFRGDDGARYKTAYIPVWEDESKTKLIAILGVVASASFFDLLTNFASGLTLIALISLLLVVVIGVAFARRLTQPLNTLVDAAKRLELGEFETPIQSDLVAKDQDEVGDEIASLALSFESMRLGILSRDEQMQMMLSGIAHEVRNPLGGMELFCGLLHEDLVFLENNDAVEKVVLIQRELTYLNKVVSDFLAFARHRPLEIERFGAASFTSELESLLCAEAQSVGCPLRFSISPQDADLTADKERLRRAVINTVRNATQASPDGGEVEVSVENSPGWSSIRIKDHGVGIPKEKLDEVLTPFFTTKEKGSGLGLALTGRIIEQHGGTMEIQSEQGVGTTVVFNIPFDDTLQAQEVKPSYGEVPEGWLG